MSDEEERVLILPSEVNEIQKMQRQSGILESHNNIATFVRDATSDPYKTQAYHQACKDVYAHFMNEFEDDVRPKTQGKG
jgi:hypothetical protein